MRAFWVLSLLVFAGLMARGADLPAACVLNIPFQVNQATPVWLGHPETPQTTFATLNLPIQPPDADASLLVTVYFQEKQGGFLRISWQGVQSAQVLSDNFYEGIGMSNQRGLLISPETLAGGGTLVFQCGDSSLGIQRIKLEWLAKKTGLVSTQVSSELVTSDSETTQSSQNLDGQAKLPDAPAWKDQVVTVPITDLPQRIEQGVEFSVQLDNLAVAARLALQVNGLPLGKHLVVWINQQRAGAITPSVPDLSDPGYLPDNSPDSYVGWRAGSFYVPAALLKSGVNTVQFSVEDENPSAQENDANAGAAVPPLAIKDVAFQLKYSTPAIVPADVTPAVTVPAPDSSTPTGPTSGPTDPATSSSASSESISQ